MIRKEALLVLLLTLPFSAIADEHKEGEKLFTTVCMACHKFERGPTMVAPPIFAVKDHYLRAHPDRDEFIMRVSSWLEQQDPEKSLMPGAMRRFNLMPPVALTEEQRNAVAGFIFDEDFSKPDWYADHFKKAHGTQ